MPLPDITILKAIPSTEPATFRELCSALGSDKPEKGDKRAWWELFSSIEKLEKQELIEVDRNGTSIDTLILTEAGAAMVRAEQKK